MNDEIRLTKELVAYSEQIGIDLIGFADPNLFIDYSDDKNPSYYLKPYTPKTVVIIGIYLYDIILDAWSQDQSTNKSFHYLDSVIENRLHLIKDFLSEMSYLSEIIPYNPGLFLKDSAALAGIGPIGKNNLIITEEYGSQVRLRALVTNSPLKLGTPIRESKYCKECSICIDKCPANALSEGRYNKKSCLAYNLKNLRKLSETTAIWCNICIEVCPVGKKSPRSSLKGHFSDKL